VRASRQQTGARNAVNACDLRVFVDQSAAEVVLDDVHVRVKIRTCSSLRSSQLRLGVDFLVSENVWLMIRNGFLVQPPDATFFFSPTDMSPGEFDQGPSLP
jgi:hypothetical protein